MLSLYQVQIEEEFNSFQARERVFIRNSIIWHLDLGLQVSKTVRNEFLLFASHFIHGILLQQPARMKTPTYFLSYTEVSFCAVDCV